MWEASVVRTRCLLHTGYVPIIEFAIRVISEYASDD